MEPKTRTIDKNSFKFTIKTLPKIDGEPNYEAINEMMQPLFPNAATLPTMQGGGGGMALLVSL